jgi:ParB family chromosome partitioning protein
MLPPFRDKVTSDVDLAYTLIQVNEKSPEEAEKFVAAARSLVFHVRRLKLFLMQLRTKAKVRFRMRNLRLRTKTNQAFGQQFRCKPGRLLSR